MKVVFIKKHPVGIEKGREVVSSPDNCQKWIDQGYAEEVTTKKAPKKRVKKDGSSK